MAGARRDRPVINVELEMTPRATWRGFRSKTGKEYRLLSEAEREYAARAGTTTPFWWGSSITPEQANYDGSTDPYKGGGAKGEYRQKTLPVKSFKPNPWGLYQVHGNVWEWVEDCWNGNYDGAPSGWIGLDYRRLQLSCPSRRLVELRSEGAPRGLPQHRRPEPTVATMLRLRVARTLNR